VVLTDDDKRTLKCWYQILLSVFTAAWWYYQFMLYSGDTWLFRKLCQLLFIPKTRKTGRLYKTNCCCLPVF